MAEQHTAGALRAAQRILAIQHEPAKAQDELARIIDEETGLPELLEACRRAEPWLGKLIAEGVHEQSVMPGDATRTLEMVTAAIAKAQAEEAGR